MGQTPLFGRRCSWLRGTVPCLGMDWVQTRSPRLKFRIQQRRRNCLKVKTMKILLETKIETNFFVLFRDPSGDLAKLSKIENWKLNVKSWKLKRGTTSNLPFWIRSTWICLSWNLLSLDDGLGLWHVAVDAPVSDAFVVANCDWKPAVIRSCNFDHILILLCQGCIWQGALQTQFGTLTSENVSFAFNGYFFIWKRKNQIKSIELIIRL